MNSHYTYPHTLEASSPDSISPPSSTCAASPDFVLIQNAPSPDILNELDMLHTQPQDIQSVNAQASASFDDHFVNIGDQSPEELFDVHCSSYNSSPVTDFEFMNSLRSIRGTRSNSDFTKGQDGPSESEAAVAETIVRARKSWKTVKGRSEPVWPPHLEKALVQALLQYKPHDSRYARALGRFPKRNRYISDYIFETTGVRRTPKQVGSRLQQLKDVSCGKMLLNHVASWALDDTSASSTSTVVKSETMSPSSFHTKLDVAISNIHSPAIDGLRSPVSPLSSGGVSMNETSFTVRTAPKPYTHSTLYLASGAHRRVSAPVSPFVSPQLTPAIRKMVVFVPFDPIQNADGEGKTVIQRRPLVSFGGCLAHPETVSTAVPVDHGKVPGLLEPRATFVARDPIAAQSVARVWVDNVPISNASSRPGTSTPAPHARMQGARVLVHERSEPLVCSQTPAARVSAAQTSFYPVEGSIPTKAGEEDHDCFAYATRLVDDEMWRIMREEGIGLRRYTITQQLMYSFDSPGTVRGETFLIITYHFAPISSSSHSVPTSSHCLSSPPDTSGHTYLRAHGHGSISPASSGTPSPVSASSSMVLPVASLQSRPGGNLHVDAQSANQTRDAHSYSQTHHQMHVPEVCVQSPLQSVSQTGGLVNPFVQEGYYNNNLNTAAFSDYDVDFSGLDMDNLHLSTSPTANVTLDQLQPFQ